MQELARKQEQEAGREQQRKSFEQQVLRLQNFYVQFIPDGLPPSADNLKESVKGLVNKSFSQQEQHNKMTWESELHQIRMEISHAAFEKLKDEIKARMNRESEHSGDENKAAVEAEAAAMAAAAS